MSERRGRGEPTDPDAPLHVVATAGHVDHGKSTLIHRLTGIDPDRLEEEKRRGLTIELGFAWCTLPSGREIGFVDVPGHERFVRTMLAGVGPVRLVLFVVAADEGWRPQSEEHLAIVDVLGVDGGVIALTKSDAVDRARLAEVERDVRERVASTGLGGASVVPCSAVTEEGIDRLTSELDRMVATAPIPANEDRARLFVDRVFTISGAGTVVTGTLTGGRLSVGDDVEALPGGARGRIRALQTHRRTVEVARPVSRVAVNLAGTDRRAVERGAVLAHRGRWTPTSVVEARIVPVRGLRHPVAERGAFTVHAGAAERPASLRVYGTDGVPRDGAFVRIRLSEPLTLDVYDRFVLRESGRRETVAGGVILDPSPPSRPGPEPERRLAARATATRDDLPSLLVRERGAVTTADVEALAGRLVDRIDGAVRVSAWWVADERAASVSDAVRGSLEELHRSSPGSTGMDVAAVRSDVTAALRRTRTPAPTALTDALIEHLVDRGAFVRDGATIALAGRRASRDDAAVQRLVDAVSSGEPTPPSLSELRAAGASRDALEAAVRAGALVRIAPDLVLTGEFVGRAIEKIRAAGSAGITVSDLRKALGTSRKFAVPLMEYLDRSGETRRSGDVRIARGA